MSEVVASYERKRLTSRHLLISDGVPRPMKRTRTSSGRVRIDACWEITFVLDIPVIVDADMYGAPSYSVYD
jgi:hypothetical protein